MRAELKCKANLPAQTRTRVNGSFPFNLKGCVLGRIHSSAFTMTRRRTVLRVHSSLLGHGPSSAPRRSWQYMPALSCQLNRALCQEAITLWTSLWERATDQVIFKEQLVKSNKYGGLHCSPPTILSTINLLQSQAASAFAPLLHLAWPNQFCAVLVTFNSFKTQSAWTYAPQLCLLCTSSASGEAIHD